MKTKKFWSLTMLICCIAIAAVAAIADLNGKWAGQVQIDGQDLPLSYNFKVDGDKLTGTGTSPYGENPIDNGKINGKDISFSTTVQGVVIPQTGKFYGDSVALDIEYQSQKYHTVLKRVQ